MSGCLVPLVMADHRGPSSCRIVPSQPTAKTSAGLFARMPASGWVVPVDIALHRVPSI
jgi:hypothetical protein